MSRGIWAIRIRLQLQQDARELALFNLAIDSKSDHATWCACDICQGGRVATHAIVMQRKTQRPVQFEITEQTRDFVSSLIRAAALRPDDHLFLQSPAQLCAPVHAPIRRGSSAGGSRVVQLLLGHSKLESSVRYLGVDVDDALEIAEQTEV